MAEGWKRTNNSNLHSENENRFGQHPYQGLEEEEESDSNQFFNMGDGFNDADQDDFEPVSPPVQNPYQGLEEEEEEEPVEILNPMQGLEIEAEEEEEEDKIGGSDEELLEKFVRFEQPRESQRIGMFGITGTTYPLSFTNQKEIPDADRVARLAFDSVLEHAYRGANDDDTFGFNITHPALDYPILGVFRQKGVKKITGNDIIERIKETKQSKKDLNFDDGMDMEVIRVDREELNKSPKKKQNKEARIAGSGYWANRKLWRGPFKPFYDGYTSDKSKSIIKIANTDNLCLFRAVVSAKAHYEHYNLGVLSRKQYRNIKDGDGSGRKQQFHAANQLMERAGLLGFNKTKKSAGIEEIQKIQKAIRKEGFQLKIFVHIEKCSKILQRNTIGFDEEIPGVPYLNIWNHHNHFDVLVKPSIFFGTMHFCDLCNKGYSEEDHRCPKMCLCSRKRGPCEKGEPKNCSSCNRSFLSQKCYENHLMKAKRPKSRSKNQKTNEDKQEETDEDKKAGKNTCEKVKRCLECKRCVAGNRYSPGSKHRCGQNYCQTCRKMYVYNPEERHLCYMQPIKPRKNKRESGLLHGEGVDDPDDEDSWMKHHERQDGASEISDEVTRYIFWDFETFLRKMPSDNENTEEEREQGKQPETTAKEKLVKIPREEYNMFCEQCRDGNCEEHKSLYQKKYKLEEKYEQVPNYCVARKACMICKYFWLSKCSNPDCKGRSCQRCENEKPKCHCGAEHKTIFEGEGCGDQFCEYLFNGEHKGVTAIAHNARGFDAQFLLQWLIKNEVKPKVIFRGRSILQLEANDVRVIDSLSFLNAKLADLPKMFNEPELKKGYFPYLFNTPENSNYVGPYPEADEYCPSQMKKEERDKFYTWYAENKDGIFDMRREIKEYTESDVDILLRCCLKFNDLFFEETGVYPLEIAMTIASACNHVFRKSHLREKTIGVIPTGGYGGKDRQSAVATEWIRWMSRELNTHINHSKNGRENMIERYKADGFIPQTNTAFEFHGCVWHGCLKSYPDNRDRTIPGGYRTYQEVYEKTVEKARNIQQMGYNYVEIWECEWKREKKANPEIRQYLKQFNLSSEPITGREALYGGRTNATVLWRKVTYLQVLEIYEVWHYEKREQYSKENLESAKNGLFAGYTNQFLKLKQEKSGWPKWVKTEGDKEQYIKTYEEKEGIKLSPDRIEKNSGLRAVAKLMLNSFWGKFAQKDDLAHTKCFTDPEEFLKVVFDNQNEIQDIRQIGEEMVQVTYRKEMTHRQPNPNTNVVIASFVTAQARLKLSYLEKLQERVLYFDTDSVIFVTRPGDKYMVSTGDYLGDMTDELEGYGQGCYISKFVSCGPKQYAFIVVDQTGKKVGAVVKAKGFSLNYANAAHINFDSMKKQVFAHVKDPVYRKHDVTITVYQNQMIKTADHKVITEPQRKKQRLCFDKRVVQNNYTSLPYGYC